MNAETAVWTKRTDEGIGDLECSLLRQLKEGLLLSLKVVLKVRIEATCLFCVQTTASKTSEPSPSFSPLPLLSPPPLSHHLSTTPSLSLFSSPLFSPFLFLLLSPWSFLLPGSWYPRGNRTDSWNQLHGWIAHPNQGAGFSNLTLNHLTHLLRPESLQWQSIAKVESDSIRGSDSWLGPQNPREKAARGNQECDLTAKCNNSAGVGLLYKTFD